MLITSYYVIKPKRLLLDLVEEYPHTRLLLSRSQVWVNEEGGYTSLRADDFELQVKFVFLIKLREHILSSTIDLKDELLEKLFEISPINVEIFDKWWSLERITLAVDFIQEVQKLTLETTKNFAPTHNPRIDGWVERLVEVDDDNLDE